MPSNVLLPVEIQAIRTSWTLLRRPASISRIRAVLASFEPPVTAWPAR